MVTEYFDYLEIEKNYSLNTIKQYKYDLLLFRKMMKLDLLFATTADIRSFLAQLKRDKNYSATTLKRKQSTLRSFYKFALKQGYVATNPIDPIEPPKLMKREAIYLTEGEKHKMFQVAREKTYTIKGKRNYAILVFLYYTGLRVHELVNLNIEDFIEDNLKITFKVIGKGNKERTMPLHFEAKRVMDIWLKEREKLKSLNNALFITDNGRRICTRSIQKIIKNFAIVAGINKKITPHKLRHTFGTQLLQNGANLVDIQNLLGHSRLDTTQIYVHTNKTNLANAIDKL